MEGNLLLLMCLLSFVIGFLSVALYVSWHQATSLMKQWGTRTPQWPHIGCSKVLDFSKDSHPCAVNSNPSLTDVPEIDEELRKVIDLLIRYNFESWYYDHISPDPVCMRDVRDIIAHIIAEVATKCKQVDFLSYFVETIMEDFMGHLKWYKGACSKVMNNGEGGQEKLMTASRISMIEDAFFEEEDSDNPWKAVCCSPEARLVYFQRVTELLLCLLLSREDFSNRVLQALLTDLGTWKIWGPFFSYMTKPDNINHAIVTLCKDSYLTPESLTTAISEGSTELELRSLQYKIHGEIKKLQKTGVTDLDHEKLSGLEALNEIARQLISGKVKSHPDHNSSLLSLNVSIPSFIITHEGSNRHCEYVLDVHCRHSQASVDEHWTTHRRYRDFQDMHLTLKNQLDNFPANLSLPSLPAFNKLDPQRLEARRQSLDKYISTVAGDAFLKEHPQAIDYLVPFLIEGEFTRSSTELTRMVDSLFKPLSNIKRSASLRFPIKKTSSIAGAGGRSHSPTPPSNSSPRPSPPVSSKRLSESRPNLGEEDEDSLPVDIMLVLLEELFDFSDKKWLRRQLPTILKQLAGDKISRKVVQKTDWLISSKQIALYIRDFSNYMWPGGIPAESHPTPTTDIKSIRSLLARAKLIGSIADEFKMLIGNESADKGMARLFGLFQSESLNFCLALRLLEGLLDTLFPYRNIRDTLRILRTQISNNKE